MSTGDKEYKLVLRDSYEKNFWWALLGYYPVYATKFILFCVILVPIWINMASEQNIGSSLWSLVTFNATSTIDMFIVIIGLHENHEKLTTKDIVVWTIVTASLLLVSDVGIFAYSYYGPFTGWVNNVCMGVVVFFSLLNLIAICVDFSGKVSIRIGDKKLNDAKTNGELPK